LLGFDELRAVLTDPGYLADGRRFTGDLHPVQLQELGAVVDEHGDPRIGA